MSKFTLFGLLAAPALVVVIGIVAARHFYREDATRQIAVFAAIVAAGGVLVNYFKTVRDYLKEERDRKKKDEDNKERVKVTPVFTPPQGKKWLAGLVNMTNDRLCVVGVEIFNEGLIPVNVRRTTLVINRSGQLQETPLLKDEDDQPCLIAPKSVVPFFTEGLNQTIKGSMLLALAADDFYIVVESFASGEVARVPGAEVQAAIRKVNERNPAHSLGQITASTTKDQIAATVVVMRPPGFNTRLPEVVGVTLYNDGNERVNIKRVVLIVNDGAGNKEGVMVTNHRPRNLSAVQTDESTILVSKKEVTFLLKNDDFITKEAILLLKPDQIWIEVISPVGRTTTVPGEAIQAAIKGSQTA